MFLFGFIFVIASVADAEELLPPYRAEVERRLNILPATPKRKERVRVALEFSALRFQNQTEGEGDPKNIPITKPELNILSDIRSKLSSRRLGLLFKTLPPQEISEDSFQEKKMAMWSQAWIAVLAVYRRLEATEEYLQLPLTLQRETFFRFTDQEAIRLLREKEDIRAFKRTVSYSHAHLSALLNRILLRHGMLSQPLVEFLLAKYQFKLMATQKRARLSKKMQDLLSRHWQDYRYSPLRTKDPAIEMQPDEALIFEEELAEFQKRLNAESLDKFEAGTLELFKDWKLGRSTSELAERYEISPGAVRNRVFRMNKICEGILATMKARNERQKTPTP